MINEAVFAQLIFPHTLQDTKTFCQLAQVSKRFHEVSKKYLIKKENIDSTVGFKTVWTELPNGQLHGLCRGWYLVSGQSSEARGQLRYEENYHQGHVHGLSRGWWSNGQLEYERNYNQEQFHGLSRGWWSNGQLSYEKNYNQGQLHGLCRGWDEDGQLWYEHNYHQGKLIEN
jgi:antitoxin component YwqK of YwqJK toxin-antitoxin module